MEVFTVLMIKASEANLLSVFRGCTALQSTFIYADDVVIFLKPLLPDLVAIKEILNMFGEASGLRINY